MLKRSSWALPMSLAVWTLTSLAPGCGRSTLPQGMDSGAQNPDSRMSLRSADGRPDEVGRLGPDSGPGAAAAPLIPCAEDSPELFYTCAYGCSSCETDVVYPMVCRNGYMACPSSYIDGEGVTITVPGEMYVVGLDDCEAKTGQCAYRQSPDAGFARAEPTDIIKGPDPKPRLAGCEQLILPWVARPTAAARP